MPAGIAVILQDDEQLAPRCPSIMRRCLEPSLFTLYADFKHQPRPALPWQAVTGTTDARGTTS
jgi:hypothetical protein